MIYYLISPNYINVVTFASIIFAFAITCLAIYMGKNILPRDGGRAYAINGSKSVGKPRGAGIIFILVFTITCMIFVNLSSEIIIYLILVLAAMLSGYLDDASSSPWGELKKGIIDFVIAVMAAVTYLHYNPNTFDISLFKLTVTLNPIIYGVLIVILIWVSINVTNCSDGVDGLCGTLSAITLSSAYVLFMIFDIESSFRHTILIMVVCILGYLWFNASPSKLLMGDAGSRAIGIFIAFAFLKLHSPLLYIPLAIVLIIDGGLGLIKVSFMILAGNIFCTSSAEYWKQVKARADIIYKGMDMNFTLNLSMADYEDSEDNKGGKVSVTVPLYSSSDKRGKADEKRAFLKEGADLIKDYEVNTNIIGVLEEQIKLKKATMYEEGAAGIEAFIKLQSSLVEAKAGKTEAERKLEAMLKY
jgi:phospho-N-acetylmuramoyl-pentapeptide-transferase